MLPEPILCIVYKTHRVFFICIRKDTFNGLFTFLVNLWYTGLPKQTVSTVMRTLKTEGLVSLRAGESDHREKKVYLTQKGTLYASELLSPLHTLDQRVFDIIGTERMKQMTDAITLFNLVFEKEMETQADEHRAE